MLSVQPLSLIPKVQCSNQVPLKMYDCKIREQMSMESREWFNSHESWLGQHNVYIWWNRVNYWRVCAAQTIIKNSDMNSAYYSTRERCRHSIVNAMSAHWQLNWKHVPWTWVVDFHALDLSIFNNGDIFDSRHRGCHILGRVCTLFLLTIRRTTTSKPSGSYYRGRTNGQTWMSSIRLLQRLMLVIWRRDDSNAINSSSTAAEWRIHPARRLTARPAGRHSVPSCTSLALRSTSENRCILLGPNVITRRDVTEQF